MQPKGHMQDMLTTLFELALRPTRDNLIRYNSHPPRSVTPEKRRNLITRHHARHGSTVCTYKTRLARSSPTVRPQRAFPIRSKMLKFTPCIRQTNDSFIVILTYQSHFVQNSNQTNYNKYMLKSSSYRRYFGYTIQIRSYHQESNSEQNCTINRLLHPSDCIYTSGRRWCSVYRIM